MAHVESFFGPETTVVSVKCSGLPNLANRSHTSHALGRTPVSAVHVRLDADDVVERLARLIHKLGKHLIGEIRVLCDSR